MAKARAKGGRMGTANPAIHKLVTEALAILSALGIPVDSYTKRRQERMAKAFLVVAGLKPGQAWSEVKSLNDEHLLLSRQVLRGMNEDFGEKIADSSYDDIRRKDLADPVEAGIVLKSAGKAAAKTNDGTRKYALNPDFAVQIAKYGSSKWGASLPGFLKGKQTLVDRLNRERDLAMVPVLIGGNEIAFSPGAHNVLQKAIIEQFLPKFGHGVSMIIETRAGVIT